MSKYLLHVDDEEVTDCIEGIVYRVPPNRPVKIESDLIAHLIMEHKHYHGLVYVNEVEDADGGVKLDVKTAKTEAAKRLFDEDQRQINKYITIQREDRLRFNFPALPPGGRMEKAIKRHNVDLSKAGIFPVGYDIEKAQRAKDQEMTQLRVENDHLREEFAALQNLVREQIAAMQGHAEKPVVGTAKMKSKEERKGQGQEEEAGAA